MEYPPEDVTHHSANRARRALTSFMPNAANHYATPRTWADNDAISMPASFRVDKILWTKLFKNICYCNIAEMRFVVKLVIVHIFR